MSNILNIAHRGFHKAFPDNTLEAFEAAICLGVDGIELDVHETADREFIVFHDAELLGKNIQYLLLSEVRNVKLQGKFEIPALEQVLNLHRKGIKLMVELKSVWSLDRLLKSLRAKAALNNIIVISFNRGLVSKLKSLAPDIQTGIITALPFRDPVKLAKSAQCDAIIVMFPFATSRLLDEAHASNLSIFVWGCPDMKAANKVLALGIDGIISDFPDLVQRRACLEQPLSR